MSYAHSERVQELSAAVFGQRHRLALMAAIAQSEDGVVNPTDLVESLRLRAQSSLQGPLNSLLAAGLVTRISGIGDRVYYRREASAAWAFALELLTRALREEAQLGQRRTADH
ncbi:ArsR family transcriptional regulator [Mycobacterium simiae]|uniref:ArsR family transcriptional regulator n=1 Tax=Mycobacterium simiae TaxID=1784 RepID=UPI0026167FA1|nr:ArsR family transcriptional regulator [Mycobacterium simiae]